MKRQAFLNPEQIRQLQEQERKSDKIAKRTPEQIEAIYTSGQNILVSASAGSGKTFVMVQRIVDQILRGVELEELFISTFTVKAATELKERLEKEITKLMQETKDSELKQHLAKQLADLPTADIGTMDSFTQKLLTKYGYLLEISPNFRILQSSSEQTLLQNEVFEQVFAQFYDGKAKSSFEHLVKNFVGTRKDIAGFKERVYQLYRFVQSTENPLKWLTDSFLIGYDELDLERERENLRQKILAALYDLETFFSHHLVNDGREFAKTKYQEQLALILEQIATLSDSADFERVKEVLEFTVAISRASNGRALTITTRKEELKELAQAYNKERKEKIETIRTLASQLYQFDYQARYHQEAREMLVTLQGFMKVFIEAYLERKKIENAYEFADISHFAIELLEKFPQVQDFYRHKYHEVMVDEYQDTSPIQERVLELLSNGQNRFMVGDIKQSIYRFRQAEPQIFNDKFKLYAENEKAGKLILLKENFRSHIEVLSITNEIFKHLMDEEVGEIRYDEQHYLVAGNPAKREKKSQYQAEFLIYDKDQVDEEMDNKSKEIAMVIQEIIRLHKEEGVAFEDIALLTSSRTRNDKILTAFTEAGIPVVSDGAESNYLQSVEVMVMLDTLRTINNPLNDYALVALLKSPMFAFTEDELARISLQGSADVSGENLYEKLQHSLKKSGQHPHLIEQELMEKLQLFESYLTNWRALSRTQSLYDLIWKIYQDRFYYDYVGSLPNGDHRQANLYALSLRANDYEKSSFKGLSRFISMIDKILENEHDLANVAVAPPQQAVQLMTIHKSKGLEFAYVFLLNLDQPFNKQDSTSSMIISRKKGVGIKYVADVALSAEEMTLSHPIRLSVETFPYQKNAQELQLATLSEQMRLLYVAMTRAEKKLYLIGKASQEKWQGEIPPLAENGLLPQSLRANSQTFQDWIWAVTTVFQRDDLPLHIRFIGDEDLTADKIGTIHEPKLEFVDSQAHNRQSEDITRALSILESVDEINRSYQAAIDLPSVRTPSQIKKLYEPVMETEGVDVIAPDKQAGLTIDWPDVTQKTKVTGALVGSAVHELMQRLPLQSPMTREILEQTLSQVQADVAVKERIDLQNILLFFETNLGKILLKHRQKVHREAPFAMLKTDPASQEAFVVRGILDGYLLLDDKIILFDYKTDYYQVASDLVARYREQLALYAEALARSYGIKTIEKYLILLGGQHLEVVRVD
ncbi:helicase-exonuclease AddAB subunit AddA [Streptococcus himalayensis]|uniref:ATP-dependent helicase/nuclease subunit A n=1 Tax=Streptococcus himalayensis TaxID=1888195 RepID=A0A917A766_9STRE|nr:helicase-exonuclease AddAB subunit AddA [Streptococcus himalayensis]GGE32478.1 ATP-dependent helicase/nuclease subunit A [Streptococcus himalayensis]